MTNTKKSNKSTSNKGKKGGISAVPPEVIGAMTGAAIGGITGMMLANKKTRDSLITVKDKAMDTAGGVLENVHVDTAGIKDDVKENVNEISTKAEDKIENVNPKKN